MGFKKCIFAIIIMNFNIFPAFINAMPRTSSLNNTRSYSLGSRSERTGMKAGWGLQNKHPSEVDLSEWGGERPSCAEAPQCPVCIP